MNPNSENKDGSAARPLRFEELQHLYSTLSPEERDELLQCLLVAAPGGGEAVIRVLRDLLLRHASDELIEDCGCVDE